MQQRRLHVLIVDDDPSFRAVVAEVLSAEGYCVDEAANGREALDMMRFEAPDLILTDLMMPVMSGWEFYAELRKQERYATVPVAVMSAVSRMHPEGTTSALKKPIDMPSLIRLLTAVDAERPGARRRSSRPPAPHRPKGGHS
jgi:CheY-like chemotaxis protein